VLQLLVNDNVVPSSLILFTLMMEATRSSKMSVFTRVTRLHLPEEGILLYDRPVRINVFSFLGLFWTYGFQLWGCTKPLNTKVIQRFQSNVLGSKTNAPWYVSNLTLHKDLQIPFVTEEIKKYSTIYHSRLIRHKTNQVTELRRQ
jgi:hypothetical protein